MAEEHVAVPRTSDAPASSGDRGLLPTGAAGAAAQVRPGDPGHAAYPLAEVEYWREAFVREPYCDPARSFEEYATAYELGWVSYSRYGGDFEPAERVLANDWLVRKGVSTLSWEQARPAVRAGWQRADSARSFVSDGTAAPADVQATLGDLLANACDAEQAFREAAARTRAPDLAALFERLGQHCAGVAADLRFHIERLGGTASAGGTVAGAAQRAWLQIRGLFGAASDETMLGECERGEADVLDRYREALHRNLPGELHALVQRQFEVMQRHRDHLRRLRDQAGTSPPGPPEVAEREPEPAPLR